MCPRVFLAPVCCLVVVGGQGQWLGSHGRRTHRTNEELLRCSPKSFVEEGVGTKGHMDAWLRVFPAVACVGGLRRRMVHGFVCVALDGLRVHACLF